MRSCWMPDPPSSALPFRLTHAWCRHPVVRRCWKCQLRPNVNNAFEDINKKIPLNLANAGPTTDANLLPVSLGLQAAPNGRRWLIYNFAPPAQAELTQIQNTIKKLINDKKAGTGPGRGGGKISVGIAQDSMIGRDAAFANTRWESWLQSRKAEGFFELWSGTVGGLLKQTGLGRAPPTTPAPQK